MRSMMALMSGVTLGASAMYLLDPDRGLRRRADLRDTLVELGDTPIAEHARPMVERARPVDTLELVRELGGEAARALGGSLGAILTSTPWLRPARRWSWRRQRATALLSRDWVVLGGLIGVIT